MAIQTTIDQPTGNSLGAKVNKFPKAQQEVIVDIIDTLNDAINGSISTTDLTLTGDLQVDGNSTIGSAAADTVTINATATYTEPINYANGTGITAFATGGQASATALTEEFNNVTTVATAEDSVKLPAAVAGRHVHVKNSGVAALAIFPATSDSIDALAVDLSITIRPGSSVDFYAKDAIVWESNIDQTFTLVAPTTQKGSLALVAADSAGNTATIITNASQAAARTYTIPDAGTTSASFLMTEGAQTINGVQTYGAINIEKAATSLTALAGGAQAGTAITSQYVNFTTVATALDSAQLPVAVLGKKIQVRNSATKPMAVFGQTGDSIDDGAVNASIIIPPNETVIFEAISGTAWKSSVGTTKVSKIITEEVTLTATEIVGTSAGDLGHGSGAVLVSGVSSAYAMEFVSAIAIYDFDTAAYTDGGNDTTINIGSGGAVLTGVVTSANLLGAAGDKIVVFNQLSTAALPLSVGTGLSMNSVTAWTQPGTAAGVLRVQVSYRLHKTGL